MFFDAPGLFTFALAAPCSDGLIPGVRLGGWGMETSSYAVGNDRKHCRQTDPKGRGGGGAKPNLIIEGDNFDALRALRVAYAGKVKCIYIDPPYNTGNRDLVYNDRFGPRP